MAKTRKTSKPQPKKVKEKTAQQGEVQPDETESTSEFDFGGLPQRELKKNLGCG